MRTSPLVHVPSGKRRIGGHAGLVARSLIAATHLCFESGSLRSTKIVSIATAALPKMGKLATAALATEHGRCSIVITHASSSE